MKSYSPFETLPALLAARSESHAERPAYVFEGETVTFAQLDERARAVHAWLDAAGVRKGDAVSVLLRNSLELVYAWLGCARAGAAMVPLNTALVGDTLAYMLGHSESVGVIADADLLAAVDAAGEFPALGWRVVRGEAPRGAVPFGELLAATGEPDVPADLEASSPLSVIYTSGTTGVPKGVVLPHGSYLNTGAFFADHLGLTDADRLHTCLPLFHVNAQQATCMPALTLGAPVALNERFSVSRFWGWIADSGATVTNLMGAMLTLLWKVPPESGDADNTLRYILSAPVPEDLHRPFEERFGLQLVEGYGLTETGCTCIINPVSDTRTGTIGLPTPYTEVRVVDEAGRDLGPDQPGEIVARSRIPWAFMTEYYKEPEKTGEAMRDGWFHTGDQGKRRSDGYFVFLDRMKDTIRRRGENISSFMVEKAVNEHPAVLESAVFGVPSELGEEDVKVLAVLRPDAGCTPAELVEWCAGRMADFMVPRYVELRDELPRTETGRVQKVRLREEGVGEAWDREAQGAVAGGRRR